MFSLNLSRVASILTFGSILFALSIVSNITEAIASDKTPSVPCTIQLWGNDCFNSRVESETWGKVKGKKYGVYKGEPTIQAVDKDGAVLFSFYLNYESDQSSNESKEIKYLRYLTRK